MSWFIKLIIGVFIVMSILVGFVALFVSYEDFRTGFEEHREL